MLRRRQGAKTGLGTGSPDILAAEVEAMEEWLLGRTPQAELGVKLLKATSWKALDCGSPSLI